MAGDDNAAAVIEIDVSGAHPAGTVLGNYRVLEVIGKGGIGHVYLAEHIKLARLVALKQLRSEFASKPGAVQRFFAEARAANQIAHENIVEVTDFIEEGEGGAYLIMEFLRGQDVSELIESIGVVPIGRALGILTQVASALGAAHAAGIVHRDLKPDNIFLTEVAGRTDFVKLLDFGIAKLAQRDESVDTSGHRTADGEVLGTPAYMSPQQARGHEVDYRSDIYSFGVIAYEMLTGRLPLKGEAYGDFVVLHATVVPPRPSELPNLAQSIPASVEDLVMRCLAKEPSERPENMEAIRVVLEAAIADHEWEVRTWVPPPRPRRRGMWVGVGAIVALALALGAYVAFRGALPWAVAAAPAHTHQVAPRASPSSPTPAVAPTPAQPTLPSTITIHIDSHPPGAAVWVPGGTAALGQTPFDTTVARGDGQRTFELRKDGFASVDRTVSLSADTQIVVDLSPETPAHGATPHAGAHQRRRPWRRGRHGAVHGHGGNHGTVDRNAVLNPFANP